MRFALKNDLNLVLPQKTNTLGKEFVDLFDRKFISNTLWERAGLKYDMFLVHTRWNHSAISQVLNDNGDVFYFSFVREPLDQFMSFWDFYALGGYFKTTLEDFAKTVISNELKSKQQTRVCGGANFKCGMWSSMLNDFGFGVEFNDLFNKRMDKKKKGVKDIVKSKIEEINNNFHMILLADSEYFEDSIILLKNALCWKYEDLAPSVKLNTRRSPLSVISVKSRNIIKGI